MKRGWVCWFSMRVKGGRDNTSLAKYAWLPPKLRCCVMKYSCCRQRLPLRYLSRHFLPCLLWGFFVFFFFLRCTCSLLCSGIFIFAWLSPSKHLLPLSTYLSYNVIVMEAKCSLIKYSLPHQNKYCLILLYNLIWHFISMNRAYSNNCDSKKLNKRHKGGGEAARARKQPYL